MTVPTPEELRQFTEEQLYELTNNADVELTRRAVIDNAEAVLRELNQKVLTAEGISMGDPWRQPTGAHDAYSAGWVVTDEGKTWESLINGNVFKPGVSGWREQVAEGEVAAWVQPTGAHDAYAAGDRVRHPADGPVWVSDIDANVWEPGVHGWTQE